MDQISVCVCEREKKKGTLGMDNENLRIMKPLDIGLVGRQRIAEEILGKLCIEIVVATAT